MTSYIFELIGLATIAIVAGSYVAAKVNILQPLSLNVWKLSINITPFSWFVKK